MKFIVKTAATLFLLCLLLPAVLVAEDNNQDQEALSELEMTLNEYREEGYNWLGPIQYLDKTVGKIKFYRNQPVSYRTLDTIDEKGEHCSIQKYDFVYVLAKHGHVVLIRLEKGEAGNV